MGIEKPASTVPATESGSATTVTALQAPADDTKSTIPSWAKDARWYWIVVPRFHNGDKSNDPGGTLPWTVDWLADVRDRLDGDPDTLRAVKKEMYLRQYGGDLQGLINRLSYLEKLGVNALIVSGLFGELDAKRWPNARHIVGHLGVRVGNADLANETDDPATWSFSKSDRLFLTFVAEAHARQIRVVVDGPYMPSQPIEVTRRWMDPNGDSNPSDGVDGWVFPTSWRHGRAESEWRASVKRLNPNAFIISTGFAHPVRLPNDYASLWYPADIPVGSRRVPRVWWLRNTDVTEAQISQCVRKMNEPDRTCSGADCLAQPITTGTPLALRLLDQVRTNNGELKKSGERSELARSRDGEVARFRLAAVLQHFSTGTPVTHYGDEVGMHGEPGLFSFGPMWWNDLPDPKTKSPDYRPDFFALIRWLHDLRIKYPALREGGFRSYITDADNRILAFGRHTPDQEVILVMNFGDTIQKVMLPAGEPGQLVGVLNPKLTLPKPRKPRRSAPGTKTAPGQTTAPTQGSTEQSKASPGAQRTPTKATAPRMPRLHIGGNRQFVNPEGLIRLWVKPMSFRVVLLDNTDRN